MYDFPHIELGITSSFHSYKWLAWISQKLIQYNRQIDVLDYKVPEAIRISLLSSIITIGPQILISLELLDNTFNQSQYEINGNFLSDMKQCIRKSFQPWRLRQHTFEFDQASTAKDIRQRKCEKAHKKSEKATKRLVGVHPFDREIRKWECKNAQKNLEEAKKNLEEAKKRLEEANKRLVIANASFRF